MKRTTSRLFAYSLFVALLLGAGADKGGLKCNIDVARAMYGSKADFGLFFTQIFNVQSRTGALGAKFKQWFKADFVDVKGKPKPSTKLGLSTFKGKLKSALSIPKKAPKDKRVTITGTQDGGSGTVQSQRFGTGTFDARVTVAVDDRTGLVSGQSLAGLELDRPADADPLDFTSIVAAYTEDANGAFLGFVVQAFEDPGVPIDDAVLIDGSPEIDLRIQQTPTQLITMARPTPFGGPSPDDEGSDWTFVSIQAISPPADPFSLGFGASNLDKKGTFFFDFFALGDTVPGPELESGMFTALLAAVLDLGNGRDALTSDVPMATTLVTGARDVLLSVQSDLTKALGAGTLDASTEGKTAAKVIKRDLRNADRLVKTLQKGQFKKPAKLEKRVQRVIDDTLVVMADLSGLKTTNPKQLSFIPPKLKGDGGGGAQACTNPPPSGGEFATATLDSVPWMATTLLARTLPDGRFDFQFEDCVGEGNYLLLEFSFPGAPSEGDFPIAPFGPVTLFVKNDPSPGAFGQLTSGTLHISSFDPVNEILEGSFSTAPLFSKTDAISDGAFRIEAFD